MGKRTGQAALNHAPLRVLSALSALLFIFQLAACASQQIHTASPGQSQATERAPRMFWTVQAAPEAYGKGILHVQGTLHLGTPELYPLDSRSLAALASADLVLAEMSPRELAGVQQLVLARMATATLRDGTSLRTLLLPDDVAWLESFIGSAVFKALESYEPWVAYSAVDQFAASRLGLDPGLGVDAALFKEAAILGKQVEGLETAAEQLRLLTGSALSLQVLLLRDSIREYRYHADALRSLYRAYLQDDRAALEREVSASIERSETFAPALAEFNDAILSTRNAAWAKRLAGWLDEGKTVYLFAGAAHFVGPGNVLARLEDYGYCAAQTLKRP